MDVHMANIPSNTEWVADLIPKLEVRKVPFMVATDEIDDELIEVFIEELQRLTGELQQGFSGDDFEMVRMAAHSIKGMGGTIGLPEISVLALEIECAVKEDRLEDTEPLITALTSWIKTFE